MQKKHFIQRNILYDLYINQGLSATKIGEIYGMSCGNVAQVLKSEGIPIRTKAEAWTIRKANNEIHTEDGNRRIAESRIGDKNHNWKGGISKYPDARTFVKNRIIVMDYHNWICQTCFGKAKDAHHIDFQKDNHQCDNLFPMCHKCHMRLHFAVSGGKLSLRDALNLNIQKIQRAIRVPVTPIEHMAHL